MSTTLAVHTTFEKNPEGKRDQLAYFSDGQFLERFDTKSPKFSKFLDGLDPSTVIRSTSANATDALIGLLESRSAGVFAAHWHLTGLETGLPPEQIVSRYAQLPDEIFRPIHFRKDIADLKAAVSIRAALQQYHGDAMRRFKQAGRNFGLVNVDELKENEIFSAGLESLGELKAQMLSENGVSFDTEVARLARKVPECVTFNEISGMREWVIAATVVATAGDVSRFKGVASLWHYMGQHVVDGRMPKRAVGRAMDWNPKGRTILHILGSCIIKNRNNPWRTYFDEQRAKEIAAHDQKHPECKTKDGHCTAMAARKTAKEILKRWYIAVTNQEFSDSHESRETQDVSAV